MNFKTSFHLSVLFPFFFTIVILVSFRWLLNAGDCSKSISAILLVLTGVLGLALSVVVIYYTKVYFKKIRKLNEWTDAVLKGNLDVVADLKTSDDEVSRLSYALSRMLREIKQAYSAIHKEASEHKQQSLEQKRLAEAAQVGTQQLSDALVKLRKSQQEIVQKERLNVYEQVIKGVVHDFGEALTPMQCTIDILLSNPDKMQDRAEMSQHLQTMSDAVTNASKSLKNLAGIYLAHPERSFGPVDVNRVIERTISFLGPRLKTETEFRGVKIDIHHDFRSVPPVIGDESDIQDVITNLTINAIEAMPIGGTIGISTNTDQTFVTIEVRDTGKGMTEEVRKRCLEPFFTTKEVAGTGMGLTIANSIVYRHKGSLSIQTGPGRGTRVSVKLPVWREVSNEKETARTDQSGGRHLSVLLVDDEALTLKVLTDSLSFLGYSVIPATNGQDALFKLRAERFDVVIVDKAMPGMDGVDLANAVKEFSADTPVIMLSGYADVMREEDGVPGSVDFLLSKPITMDDLNKALTQVVGMKK